MKRTVKLRWAAGNGGPFSCYPAGEVEMSPERVLANDVTFPWEGHPHNMRLFLIGNEYGALAAVWAGCDQDAFDEACDADLLAGLSCSDEDLEACDRGEDPEGVSRLGNAGEPVDLTHAWIRDVLLDIEKDGRLLVAFAEARGAGYRTLEEVV